MGFFALGRSFTRQRKLPLLRVVELVLYLCLDRNFSQNLAALRLFDDRRIKSQTPLARSSISEARQKIGHEAFAFLFEQAAVSTSSWHGFRPICVDGSRTQLPHSKPIIKSFPVRKTGEHFPQALLLTAFNAISKQPIFAEVGNIHSSEQALLSLMMPKFSSSDLLILDRGFHSSPLMQQLVSQKTHFLIRLRNTKSTRHLCRRNGRIVEHKGMKLRFFRHKKILLVTSVLDISVPNSELAKLYFDRWHAETQFRRFKQSLSAAKFHSQLVNGVKQEIYATLVVLSLLSALCFEAQKKIKSGYQINFEVARNFLREVLLDLFSRDNGRTLRAFLRRIQRFLQKKRPRRSYKRISKQPENKWVKARRTNNHVHRDHFKRSDKYRKRRA